MISLKLCRNILIRSFVALVIISSLFNIPAYSQESEDSQVFISGFNAYQKKDYATTISRMNEVLQKFPDTPLRDMVLFWLSRAYYKNGNQQDAARFMSQFSKEYPDNPLKGTVDDELLALTARYERGEKLPVGPTVVSTAEKDRLAGVEADRLAKEQAERERIAAAKAEEDRVAAAAETARVAAARQQEERKAAEQAEKLRVERDKAEKDQLAKNQAERERVAAVKAEETRAAEESARLAAVKLAEERKAADQAERIRLAEVRKEQERTAAVKADEERAQQEKAAQATRAVEQAELQKLAALKADEERKAAEKLKAEQTLQENTDHEQLVKQQDELVRQALAKAEKKRLAAEKLEEQRNAGDVAAKAAKAELKRLAALKAEEERVAAEAETARLNALKAAEERKAEQLRAEQEKTEKARVAAAAAEANRLAEARKELERKAVAKAEADRMEQEKAALTKRAAVEAEQQKLALAKKEQERLAAERVEKERLAIAAAEASQRSEKAVKTAETAKTVPVAAERQREADEKVRAEKYVLRDKAIAQYRSILVTYPHTKAASAAAVKLKELGVAVALPVQTAAEPASETAQVLRFEVAQFAGLEFNLPARPQAYNVAQRVSLPFEITNQGNGSDSFYLESGFPSEFSAGFTSAAAPGQSINQTSVLAPGESFKGLVHLTIPASSIDGLRISHPIKASSRMMPEATQSREVKVFAAAPLLRATIKADRSNPLPGEKITYRVALLNVGSTGAQDVSFRLNFPPQLEPVDYAATGFRQEMKAALVIDGIQLKSGESREFSLAFQLRDGTLAGQEILTRAELYNNQLKTTSAFVSSAAYVQPQHGLQVSAGSERLVVIPGQTVSIPFVVTNSGNVREKFTVVSSSKSGQKITIFHDLNRDGVRQANEPVVTEIGPLAAKEEASIVLEIVSPRSAADGSEDSAQISFRSEGDASRSFAGITRLIYSRPVLQMAMSGRNGKLKPGEVTSFDLTITNRGSNLARVVDLKSAWPEQLELVAADPANSSVSNGTILWKFTELGAGEKRVIKVSFRVKPGTGMGTNIQVKNILTYEDQIGNRY